MGKPVRKGGSIENIRNISDKQKWVKELVGFPTYIAAVLISILTVGDNTLVSFVVVISFVMIYHYLYAYLFPDFNAAGKKQKLAIFAVAQILFWMIVLTGINHFIK